MPLVPSVPEAQNARLFCSSSGFNRVLTGRRGAPRTQLWLAQGGLLCKRTMPGEHLYQSPDTEPRARLQRVGSVPGPRRARLLITGARGRRPKPAPRSPPAPARLPPARPGLRGCAGAGAAAGILHPGRFCLPRAESRGLKVFHLERQSAFFLSIPGQTPMVPGTSLLPNGGAASSFGRRVILLALLCWNSA